MKPKKLVQEKNLSGLDGVRHVTVGKADPDARMRRDFGKTKAPEPSMDYDDFVEPMKRWGLPG